MRSSSAGSRTATRLPEIDGAPGSPAKDGISSVADLSRIAQELLSPAGLTKQSSSFDRRDVLLGVAEALRNGASVAYLEAIADRLLCHPEVVALAGQTNDVIRTDGGRVISRASTGGSTRA